MIELVLGGARSGKSRFAEMQASACEQVTYIATARYNNQDEIFCERIRQHKERRPSHWNNLEEPLALLEILEAHSAPDQCILVDCLTLWISNSIYEDESKWPETHRLFVKSIPSLPGKIILVSNEVGQGIMPANTLARNFIDLSGALHQSVAAIADAVYLVTAGIAQQLK